MSNLESTQNALFAEWKKPNKNLKLIGELLNKLKISLIQSSFLPVGKLEISAKELTSVRDILEIGTQFSVLSKDIASFERYISQLKCYYFDYKNFIGESKEKYKILGLNLLYLLSQNRVAEFHTELELLPVAIIQTDRYIRYPLELEQFIMEGRYNKVFAAKENSPTDVYNFFIDILIETVVNEIARCLEKSYESISLEQVAKRLNFKNKADVDAFGKSKGWVLVPSGCYVFSGETSKQDDGLPSVDLAEKSILYAKELEMIV